MTSLPPLSDLAPHDQSQHPRHRLNPFKRDRSSSFSGFCPSAANFQGANEKKTSWVFRNLSELLQLPLFLHHLVVLERKLNKLRKLRMKLSRQSLQLKSLERLLCSQKGLRIRTLHLKELSEQGLQASLVGGGDAEGFSLSLLPQRIIFWLRRGLRVPRRPPRSRRPSSRSLASECGLPVAREGFPSFPP